jgi:hypothetical protein
MPLVGSRGVPVQPCRLTPGPNDAVYWRLSSPLPGVLSAYSDEAIMEPSSRRRVCTVALSAAFALLAADQASVRAQSSRPDSAGRSFAQLVSDAPVILVTRVAECRAQWEDYGESRLIITRVTLAVDDVLKGSASAALIVEVVGGTMGEVTLRVSDTPEFRVGDRDVLFLTAAPHAVSPLVGSTEGRFRVVTEVATGVERVITAGWLPLTSVASIGAPGAPAPALSLRSAVTLEDFAAQIRDAARAGRGR